MKVSYRSEYAVRVLIYLASRPERTITINEIASRGDLPVKFLEQILLQLKHGGYVVSRRGARGGYLLARRASEITLLEVLELTEGSLTPEAGNSEKGGDDASGAEQLALLEVLRGAAKASCAVLAQATIASLLEQSRTIADQGHPMYFI